MEKEALISEFFWMHFWPLNQFLIKMSVISPLQHILLPKNERKWEIQL